MHPFAPSQGQEGPPPANLGRESPRHGLQQEPRAPLRVLAARQLSQLPAPGGDASRQLAQEGAQNNPDSWGEGGATDTGAGLFIKTPGTGSWLWVVAS